MAIVNVDVFPHYYLPPARYRLYPELHIKQLSAASARAQFLILVSIKQIDLSDLTTYPVLQAKQPIS